MNVLNSQNRGISFINITQKEMDALFDAMNNTRVQFTVMLQMQDQELSKATGVHTDSIQELRDVLQDKIDFYNGSIKKINKYVKHA